MTNAFGPKAIDGYFIDASNRQITAAQEAYKATQVAELAPAIGDVAVVVAE